MEILLLLEGLCDNFLGGFLSVFIFLFFLCEGNYVVSKINSITILAILTYLFIFNLQLFCDTTGRLLDSTVVNDSFLIAHCYSKSDCGMISLFFFLGNFFIKLFFLGKKFGGFEKWDFPLITFLGCKMITLAYLNNNLLCLVHLSYVHLLTRIC
jgi:hypothetical protein